MVVPTSSPAVGSSLTNRGLVSAAPEVDVAPGRLRFDNEPPRLLCPNRPWAWHESDIASTNKTATMSMLNLRPDAPRREFVAKPVIDSFAENNAGVIGVSIRLPCRNVQVVDPLISCKAHPSIAQFKSRLNHTSLLIRLPVKGIVAIPAIVGRSADSRLSSASSLTDSDREVGTSAIWADCEFCGKFGQNSIRWRLPC